MSKEEPPKKRCSELCGIFVLFFLFCFRFSCLFLRGRRCQNIWACVVLCVTVCGRCGKNICDVCVAGLAIRHGVSVSVLVAGAVITIWVYVSMQPASLCSRNTVQKMRLCCVFCVIRYPNYPVKRYAYELLECRVFRLLYCTVGYKLTKRSMAVFWSLGCFWHFLTLDQKSNKDLHELMELLIEKRVLFTDTDLETQCWPHWIWMDRWEHARWQACWE